MRTIYLTLLLLLPTSLADVDCRSACQNCNREDQPTEILDIYCSMCHECNGRMKDKRRMAMLRKQNIKLFQKKPQQSDFEHYNNDVAQLRESQFGSGHRIFAQRRDTITAIFVEVTKVTTPFNIAECPTAEPCSDEEEPSTTTTTTTTTTTPAPTCPPIKTCKTKKRTTASPPATSPCVPYLCPVYIPAPPPPPAPMLCMPPQPCAFPAPYPAYPHYPAPLPYPPPPPPSSETLTSQSTSKKQEFLSMYLGVPKDKLRRTLYK